MIEECQKSKVSSNFDFQHKKYFILKYFVHVYWHIYFQSSVWIMTVNSHLSLKERKSPLTWILSTICFMARTEIYITMFWHNKAPHLTFNFNATINNILIKTDCFICSDLDWEWDSLSTWDRWEDGHFVTYLEYTLTVTVVWVWEGREKWR